MLSTVFGSCRSAYLRSKHGGIYPDCYTFRKASVIFSSTKASFHDKGVGFDEEYPGTAVSRMWKVRERVSKLTVNHMNCDWKYVRKHLLWAGGLKETAGKSDGTGDTSQCFNDFNHCDLMTVKEDFATNESAVETRKDSLFTSFSDVGNHMSVASIRDLGPGGSWTTCMVGCSDNPPKDEAHVKFRSRIAFKLVWVPGFFDRFVLVDDDGHFLNMGKPTGQLPDYHQRQHNYKIVHGSKYATVANAVMLNHMGNPWDVMVEVKPHPVVIVKDAVVTEL